MNTETRLRDALGAAARTVPANAASPGLEPATGRPATAGLRWPAISLAAAAVVTLAAVVPAVLLRSALVEPSAQAGKAPPYFIALGYPDKAGVYNSETGKQITTVPLRSAGTFVGFTSVTAATDQRTYYLAGRDKGCDSTIVRVVLRDDGTVRQVRTVPGTEFRRQLIGSLTVSPDGRKLAFHSRLATPYSGVCTKPANTTEAVRVRVVDLGTGDQRTWTAPAPVSPEPSKGEYMLPSELAWAPDNRGLVFQSATTVRDLKLRILDTRAPGDDLRASRVVLNDASGVQDISVSADGRSVQAVRGYALVRIDLEDGGIEVLDSRLKQKEITSLEADASGRHFLASDLRSSRDGDQTLPGGVEAGNSMGIGRYDDGKVSWFDGTSPLVQLAW